MHGKVWPDPRQKKRNRFTAWLCDDAGIFAKAVRKQFPTRRAAADWLIAMGAKQIHNFD